MNDIHVDYVLSSHERNVLNTVFSKITTSPYLNYAGFQSEVMRLIANRQVVSIDFVNFCNSRKYADTFEEPYVRLANCPVDSNLPDLNLDDPVVDKRERKTTFVTEAFLLLYAVLMDQQPIGYINVNDGDVFQDIHPMRSLLESQSQKASKSIYFHKDLANHFVRPDWVNIIGLRASSANEIYTSFVRNKDLIGALEPEILTLLRREEFNTPYDDLTVSASNVELGDAPNHRILGGAEDHDIRFFENRTKGVNSRAQEAVDEVARTLHVLKRRVSIQKGDFLGSANNECIHCKEVVRIGDESAVMSRWLMKTVNVRSLDVHKAHLRAGEVRIIDG